MSNDAPGDSAGRKRRAALFRQHDVTRALRAARAAGLEVTGYEIDPTGKITVTTGGEPKPNPQSELRKWLAKRARSSEGHTHN